MKHSALAGAVLAGVLGGAWTSAADAQSSMLLPAEQDAHLADVAIEAARRGPVAPIPLIGDGPRMLGAVYDRYRVGVLAARARLAAGETVDRDTLASLPAWQSRAAVVVAYPIDCDGRPNRPLAIRVQSRMQGPVAPAPVGAAVRGSEAGSLLPNLALPADALVVAVRNLTFFGETVFVDYDGPACRGAARTAALPLQTTPSRELAIGFNGVRPPPDQASVPSPSTVRLQVFVDADGRVRFPNQVQGPAELGPAAIALVGQRRFEPFRVNGEGFALWTMVTFVFTANGEPATPAPFTPPGAPGNTMTVTRSVVAPAPASPAPPAPVAPAPPGQTDAQLARLAIEIAEQRDPAPVPLDAAGPPVHGLLFDRFTVGVARARAAIARGDQPEPGPALVRNDAVVVAFRLACGPRTVVPIDIALVEGGTTPGPVRASSAMLTGDRLAALLPGVSLPQGATGRTFASAGFSQNLEARITYAEPICTGDARHVVLPIQWVRGSALPRMTTVKLPEGSTLASPTAVRLRGLVDLDGRYRFPTIAEGPEALGPAAVTVASQWRFQPYRANGVPVPQVVITTLTFTQSGAPEPAARAGQPPPSAMPPIAASTTVAGRPPELATPDVPGLSTATSQCIVSDDEAYGYSATGAIGVGGSFTEGPARARRYLTALRGPQGQGLRMVRRGSTLGPDGSTILDLYEITYAGLAQPLRVFVDQYHTTPLRAPKGLVCATPVEVK